MDTSSDDENCSELSINSERDESVLSSSPPTENYSFDESSLSPLSVHDDLPAEINFPEPGQPVDRRLFRKAGPYIIGPRVYGYKPLSCMILHIARKEDSNTFYLLKILQLSQNPNKSQKRLKREQRGKILMHTEYSLLSMLKNEPGVIKQHGMFSDLAYDEVKRKRKVRTYTGGVSKRLILVLDCIVETQYCAKTASYVSLQEYRSEVEDLSEVEALSLLYETVKVVENIHKKNIVHRDLKLGNIVLNKSSKSVILVHFCIGRYLPNESALIHDQKGTPAYMSPELISGRPYRGKPCDMWALGIIYFVMLCGSFPFFHLEAPQLYAQIQRGEFEIPNDVTVSENSYGALKELLNIDPWKRPTAVRLRSRFESMLAMKRVKTVDQIVPELEVKAKYLMRLKVPKSLCDDQVVPTFTEQDDEQTVPKQSVSISMNTASNSKTRGTKRPYSQAVTTDSAVPSTSNASNVSGNGTSASHQSLDLGGYSLEDLAIEFTVALNEMFLEGLVVLPYTANLREFDGVLSDDFATSLISWLTREMSESEFVQYLLVRSDDDPVTKIKNFLVACDIEIDFDIHVPIVSSRQNEASACILTYLLRIAGYDNTYIDFS